MMDDYSILCPICIETFRSPRVIKECGHSFCEQCLCTYINALKDKGELGSTFPCPLCRHGVPTPPDTDVTLSWIQAFPVDEKLTQKCSSVQAKVNDGKMSSDILCDPCRAENIHNRVIQYCVNCQEYLCKDCVVAHGRFKLFRDHSLSEISVDLTSNKLKDLVSIKCEKHPDQDVEIYCHSHHVYSCLKCATVSHRECSKLTEVVGMEALANKRIADFYQKCQLAEKHIDELLLMQKKSFTELLRNKEKITQGLTRLRNQIVSEIDEMIENFDAQIKQQLIVLDAETNTHIEKINVLKGRCKKTKEMIETVKEYGHPAQKVISQTKIAEEYVAFEKDITDAEKTIHDVKFCYRELDRLETIQQELIKCKQEQISVVRHARDFVKYKEAVSTTRNRHVVRTEERRIRLVQNCVPLYTGVTLIDDKHLLLCDSCGKTNNCGHVCLYDIESKTITKLKMNKPFSAAVLKNNPSLVAVSVPTDKEIHIVSIKGKTLEVEKTFKCDKKPYSLISFDNGHVGVTWDSPPSFDIVDMSGYEIKTLTPFTQDSTGRKFKSFQYVAVDELRSHIVQSCEKDRAIYCFDFSGNPIFEHKDTELKYPQGVDIDRDGNIYICCWGSHTLHVLTPSGRKTKVVEDMPVYPKAISFDETGEKFWLTHGVLGPRDEVCLFSLVE